MFSDHILEYLVLMSKHEKGAGLAFPFLGLTYGLCMLVLGSERKTKGEATPRLGVPVCFVPVLALAVGSWVAHTCLTPMPPLTLSD